MVEMACLEGCGVTEYMKELLWILMYAVNISNKTLLHSFREIQKNILPKNV